MQPFRWSRHLYLARYSHERVHSARRQDTCVSWFAFGLINREATPTFRGPFHSSPIRLRPFSWSGRIYVVSYTGLSFSFSSLFTPFFNYRSSENYSPNNSLKVFLFSDLSFIVNFQFHSQTDQITFLLLRTLVLPKSPTRRERERDIRDVSRISLARLVDSRFHITTLLPVARDVTDRS